MEKKLVYSMTKRTRIAGFSSLCVAVLAFVWSGCTKAGSMTNVSTATYLSVIHGAPYTSAINVYLNDTLITPSAIPTGQYSPRYGTRRPGFYSTEFKKAGTDSLLDQVPASLYDTLNFYTLLLYNDPGGKAAHVVKIFDDFSSVTSNSSAYYRFFNLAPDNPSVNLYFNGTIAQSARTPASNLANNGFQPIQAGTYTISVRDAYTDSALVTSQSVNLMGGYPFTIWITGTTLQKNLAINVLQAQLP